MPRVYLSAFLVLMLNACNLFDKEETIPGFIHISYADLITNEATEGAPTHGIFDVHVFANEDFVGSYELPATIAILKNGPTTLNISAGIKNNGMFSNRILYPFYAPLVLEKDLIPGAVLPIRADSTAVFRYFADVFTFFNEDFEGVGIDFSTSPNSSTEMVSQGDVVRSGLQSGRISLTENEPYFLATSDWVIGGLTPGTKAFMEIDFKGNNPLEIGLVRQGQRIFVLGLNAQSEWTKVYIDLTPTIGLQIGNNPFGIYLETQILPGVSTAEMYVDNIKLLYPN